MSCRHPIPSLPPLSTRDQSPNQSHSPSTHVRPNLPQTLTNPQNAINQQPIRRSLDLKVAKESVRAKQTEYLIQRIVTFGIGFWAQMCREGSIEGECIGWSADSCSEGEQREVSDQGGGGLRGVVVEYAVVRLGIVSTRKAKMRGTLGRGWR
jgi:hypothetical protein